MELKNFKKEKENKSKRHWEGGEVALGPNLSGLGSWFGWVIVWEVLVGERDGSWSGWVGVDLGQWDRGAERERQ